MREFINPKPIKVSTHLANTNWTRFLIYPKEKNMQQPKKNMKPESLQANFVSFEPQKQALKPSNPLTNANQPTLAKFPPFQLRKTSYRTRKETANLLD